MKRYDHAYIDFKREQYKSDRNATIRAGLVERLEYFNIEMQAVFDSPVYSPYAIDAASYQVTEAERELAAFDSKPSNCT